MLKLLIACFAIAACLAEVYKIGKDTIDHFIEVKKTEDVIAVYYVKNHKLSQNLIKRLNGIAESMPKVHIFTVECSVRNKKFCGNLKLTHMPYVELTRFGISRGINGQLSNNEIWKFLNEGFNTNIQHISSDRDISAIVEKVFLNNAIIIVKGFMSRKLKKRLMKAFFEFKDHIGFYYLKSAESIDKFSLADRPYGIYMIKHGIKDAIEYNSKTHKDLRDFIIKTQYEDIEELTQAKWDAVKNIVFSELCKETEIYTVKEANTFVSYPNIKFYAIDMKTDADLFSSLKLKFGIPDECSLLSYKMNDNKEFELHILTEEFNSHSVSMFVNLYANDKIEVYKRSKARSLLSKREINRVILEKEIMKMEKALFILFYRPVDVNSPLYSKFTSLLSLKNQYFILRTIDIEHNDIDNIGKDFPSVYAYVYGPGKNPVLYDGELTEQALDEYMHSILSSVVDTDI